MSSVLIVDDERPVTDAFATFFERHGNHSVSCAYTGAEAIAAYEASRPDLVLLDLRLPDMTGFDVYARIREHSPVVIMISGHGDVPLAVQALQSGAENFLTKPVELAHLAIAAERAFEKVRLRQLNQYLSDRRGGAAAKFALGSSSVMRDLAAQVELLAASDRTTVLLLGRKRFRQGTRRRADSLAQPAAHECVRRGELRRADTGRARGRALRTGRCWRRQRT